VAGPVAAGQSVDQQVLQQVRLWIEPAQSFEKNQLGLSAVFFNRLRFTWTMALLANAAVLLRARALLGRPALRPLRAHDDFGQLCPVGFLLPDDDYAISCE
jgi:hypothetical protein